MFDDLYLWKGQIDLTFGGKQTQSFIKIEDGHGNFTLFLHLIGKECPAEYLHNLASYLLNMSHRFLPLQ